MLLGSPESMIHYYYLINLNLMFKVFSLDDVGVGLVIQSFLNRGNYFMGGFFSFADLVFVAC